MVDRWLLARGKVVTRVGGPVIAARGKGVIGLVDRWLRARGKEVTRVGGPVAESEKKRVN